MRGDVGSGRAMLEGMSEMRLGFPYIQWGGAEGPEPRFAMIGIVVRIAERPLRLVP